MNYPPNYLPHRDRLALSGAFYSLLVRFDWIQFDSKDFFRPTAPTRAEEFQIKFQPFCGLLRSVAGINTVPPQQ